MDSAVAPSVMWAFNLSEAHALTGSEVPWVVVAVRPLPGYRLSVRFVDGTEGEVDLSPFLFGPRPGVFEHLRDEKQFAEVYVNDGAVTWPGELDLAPDAMYDDIKAQGSYTIKP
jgi:hypothetical protein